MREVDGGGCGEQAMDGLRPDFKTGGRQEGAATPAIHLTRSAASEAAQILFRPPIRSAPILRT